MAYETEIAELATWKWDRIDFTENDKTKEKELVRGYGGIRDDLLASMLAYLATLPTATNPVADGRQYDGLYRIAGHTWDQRSQRYVQTLKFGWATSVLTGNSPNKTPNTECLVAAASDSRTDQRSMTLLWKNIAGSPVSPGVAATLAVQTELRTQGSFSSPSIQGETKTGTWAIGAISEQQQPDGSYWVTVQCTLATSLNGLNAAQTLAALQALTPLRGDVRDIENPFGLEGGFTAAVAPETVPGPGRRPTEGIALTYSGLTANSRTALLAMTDIDLGKLLTGADLTNFRFVKRQVSAVDEQTGTITLSVAYQYIPLSTAIKEKTSDSGPAQISRFVSLERSNQSGKVVLTRSFPRINPANAASIMAGSICAAVTITNPYADDAQYPGEYLVKTTKSPMTANDGVDIIQELTLVGDADIDVYVGANPDHGSYEKYLFETTETAVETFLGAATFPDTTPSTRPAGWAALNPAWSTSQAGITKLVKITPNADGSVNLYAFYSSAANLAQSDLTNNTATGLNIGGSDQRLNVGSAATVADKREWGWNLPIAYLRLLAAQYAPDGTPANNVNIVRDFKVTRRDDRTFDFWGEIKTLTKRETGEYTVEEDAAHKLTRKAGDLLTAAEVTADYAAPAESVAGETVTTEKKANEHGSFEAIWQKLTKKDQQSTSAVSTPGLTVEVTEHTEKAEEQAAGVAGIGVRRTATNEPTPTGRHKTKLEVATKTDLPYSKAEATVMGTKTVEGHTAAAVAMTVGAAAVNRRETVDQVRDPETGEYKGEKAVEVASPVVIPAAGSAVLVSDDGLIQEALKIHRNVTAIPPASAGGTVRAKDNGLGAIDAEEIIRSLRAGEAVRTCEQESVGEVDMQQMPIKVARYSVSTDGADPANITGYDYYLLWFSRSRIVTFTAQRTYSLTHPTIASITPGTVGEFGAATSRKKRVLFVAAGLYATEELTIEAGPWSAIDATSKRIDWICYVALDDSPG